jgi:hypothetical protein
VHVVGWEDLGAGQLHVLQQCAQTRYLAGMLRWTGVRDLRVGSRRVGDMLYNVWLRSGDSPSCVHGHGWKHREHDGIL